MGKALAEASQKSSARYSRPFDLQIAYDKVVRRIEISGPAPLADEESPALFVGAGSVLRALGKLSHYGNGGDAGHADRPASSLTVTHG